MGQQWAPMGAVGWGWGPYRAAMGTHGGCGVGMGTLWGSNGHPWGLWGGDGDPIGQQWAPMGAVGWGWGPYRAAMGTHGCSPSPLLRAMGQRTPTDPIDLSVRCGRANCRERERESAKLGPKKPQTVKIGEGGGGDPPGAALLPHIGPRLSGVSICGAVCGAATEERA